MHDSAAGRDGPPGVLCVRVCVCLQVITPKTGETFLKLRLKDQAHALKLLDDDPNLKGASGNPPGAVKRFTCPQPGGGEKEAEPLHLLMSSVSLAQSLTVVCQAQ